MKEISKYSTKMLNAALKGSTPYLKAFFDDMKDVDISQDFLTLSEIILLGMVMMEAYNVSDEEIEAVQNLTKAYYTTEETETEASQKDFRIVYDMIRDCLEL